LHDKAGSFPSLVSRPSPITTLSSVSASWATETGLPWLLHLRRQLGDPVHFWPFDGWDIPAGLLAVLEVYPALWKHAFPKANRTPDQHDAHSAGAWLRRADLDGRLEGCLSPSLTPSDRPLAEVEGWILGVA
jgi:hypothetical protein